MQVVEPFTAHYVFALGIARFLSCAHWILQVNLLFPFSLSHRLSIVHPTPIGRENFFTSNLGETICKRISNFEFFAMCVLLSVTLGGNMQGLMHALFYPQVLDGHSFLLNTLGYGLWPGMVLLSEIVQTIILADFCYYYVKRYVEYITQIMNSMLISKACSTNV